jgi:hypothetical protein
MIVIGLVGLGAGLVSALLFAVVITGSPLGLLLSYVAPLPILIASLGWNHRSGLVASVVGAVATAFAFRFEAGLAFAAGSALPGWWLAYIALLGRPVSETEVEWYPLGRLLVWLAVASAAITVAGALALGGGSYDSYRTVLTQAMETVLQIQTRTPGAPAPPSFATPEFAARLVELVPLVATTIFALVLILNLWMAAKVVSVSQRLPRPWPAISETVMPMASLGLLAGAIVLAFLPGFLGVVGLALVGGLTMAFALQGLAFVHAATKGRSARTALLTTTYVLALLFGHTVIPLLAITGMADTGLSLRRRITPPGAPPRPPLQ